MDSDSERQKTIKELKSLNDEIKKFKLSDSERKHEKMELLHKYNDTKDYAQTLLGALAECEKVSIGVLYKKLKLENLES